MRDLDQQEILSAQHQPPACNSGAASIAFDCCGKVLCLLPQCRESAVNVYESCLSVSFSRFEVQGGISPFCDIVSRALIFVIYVCVTLYR